MSVTTTENRTYYAATQALRDYEIHHSGDENVPLDGRTNPRESSSENNNPADWPTEHRRMPNHRPVNTNLDLSQRGARNTAEAMFAFTMLNGVYINATVAKLWRNTGGKLNDQYFRYKIGGEW